jgi:hypothetical protein
MRPASDARPIEIDGTKPIEATASASKTFAPSGQRGFRRKTRAGKVTKQSQFRARPRGSERGRKGVELVSKGVWKWCTLRVLLG